MKREEIFNKVKNILGSQLITADIRQITEDTLLESDLGADSIDAVEIIMETEKAFGINIKEDEIPQHDKVTVRDFINIVASCISKQNIDKTEQT